MQTFIKPTITIREPKRNQTGIYVEFEKKNYGKETNINSLKIKTKSISGKKRGVVGEIDREGTIRLFNDKVNYLITTEVRKKIKTITDFIYHSTSIATIEGELVKIVFNK